MILSKFSCREFLEIYNTREPHQSQKWAIWRPFSWVGDDFVQIFMSRVFFRSIVQKSHINHRIDPSGDHFQIIAHSWKWSPDSSLLWLMWLSCIVDLKKLSTWKLGQNHRPLKKMVSRWVNSVIDVALLYYRSEKNSRHENLDEIIAHSWKWSPDSSLLWMLWLSCIIDLKKLSTWNFGRNHRPLMKMVSR